MDISLTTEMISYLDSFKSYLEGRNYSVHTIKNYTKYVELFLKKCYHDSMKDVAAPVTTIYIQEYIDDFKDHPATANLVLNSLRAYYNYLHVVCNVIDTNPALGVRGMKLETEEKEYLTPDQVSIVMSSIEGRNQNRNRLIIALMAVDCLRISEVMNIDLDDINVANRTIYIHGKGKRNRIAYLTESMLKYLLLYLEDRGKIENLQTNALFPSSNGIGRIARSTIELFIKNAEKKTGIKLNPHKFRHTGATLAYQQTKDLVAVQNLLGHENVESTKRYTHVREEDRRNLIESSPLNAIL